MSEKSVIIIGAGLAGLSAGCFARANRYRTQIFEHHTLPGGVCTSWVRHGYTVDGCIHWLMGCRPTSSLYRLYEDLGVVGTVRFLRKDHFTTVIDQESGATVAVTSDLERLGRDLLRIASVDAGVITELLQAARDLQSVVPRFDGPPRQHGLSGDLIALKQMARYWTSVGTFAARRIRTPILRTVLESLFLAEMPLALLLITLGQLASGQLAVVEGGSQRFSDAIAVRYRELGGSLTYGAEVVEIVVEGGRAVGVRLADGATHRADVVVSAADGQSTIFRMLGGRFVDQSLLDRYRRWPRFAPVHLVSFGVADDLAGFDPALTLLLDAPFPSGGMVSHRLGVRIFNYDSTLAPSGKTVVQAMLQADWDHWDGLKDDRALYKIEKDRIAQEVLCRLDRHIPGLASKVEMTDVATPPTMWRYTRNHRGAFEGWLMTPEMLRVRVPKRLPGLENFFMAGQWVEPGGGIAPALASGKQVIQELCRGEGRLFTDTIAR